MTCEGLRRLARSVNVWVGVLLFDAVGLLEELVDLFADDFGVPVEIEALSQRNRFDFLSLERARQQALVAHLADLSLHFSFLADFCVVEYIRGCWGWARFAQAIELGEPELPQRPCTRILQSGVRVFLRRLVQMHQVRVFGEIVYVAPAVPPSALNQVHFLWQFIPLIIFVASFLFPHLCQFCCRVAGGHLFASPEERLELAQFLMNKFDLLEELGR